MEKKTIEHAAGVLRKIKAETNESVIKDYEMPRLCDEETAVQIGFAVILTLSTKFVYTSNILNQWRERLAADDYLIRVNRNQLHVRFNVTFDKEGGDE